MEAGQSGPKSCCLNQGQTVNPGQTVEAGRSEWPQVMLHESRSDCEPRSDCGSRSV